MRKPKMIVIQSDCTVCLCICLCAELNIYIFVQRTLVPTIAAGSPLFKLTFPTYANTQQVFFSLSTKTKQFISRRFRKCTTKISVQCKYLFAWYLRFWVDSALIFVCLRGLTVSRMQNADWIEYLSLNVCVCVCRYLCLVSRFSSYFM